MWFSIVVQIFSSLHTSVEKWKLFVVCPVKRIRPTQDELLASLVLLICVADSRGQIQLLPIGRTESGADIASDLLFSRTVHQLFAYWQCAPPPLTISLTTQHIFGMHSFYCWGGHAANKQLLALLHRLTTNLARKRTMPIGGGCFPRSWIRHCSWQLSGETRLCRRISIANNARTAVSCFLCVKSVTSLSCLRWCWWKKQQLSV